MCLNKIYFKELSGTREPTALGGPSILSTLRTLPVATPLNSRRFPDHPVVGWGRGNEEKFPLHSHPHRRLWGLVLDACSPSSSIPSTGAPRQFYQVYAYDEDHVQDDGIGVKVLP